MENLHPIARFKVHAYRCVQLSDLSTFQKQKVILKFPASTHI